MGKESSSCGLPVEDHRAAWLMQHEAWLRVIARVEVDSRFYGKFSASDAVQQTMLEAWQHWDQFRGTEEAQRVAWLRQILAHQLAHLARHFAGTKKRDVSREQSLDQSLAQSAGRLANMLPGPDQTPSLHAVQLEQQRALAEVLERLPADYRQVIVLRHLQDLSHAEIGRLMERNEGAVRMLWVRALKRLREELGSGQEDTRG